MSSHAQHVVSKNGRQFNSWAPGIFSSNPRSIVFKLIILNSSLGSCCEIILRGMPQDLTNGKSTLVQIMAWCHQAPSHYLSQCWSRSMSSYGITWSQSVNKPKSFLNIRSIIFPQSPCFIPFIYGPILSNLHGINRPVTKCPLFPNVYWFLSSRDREFYVKSRTTHGCWKTPDNLKHWGLNKMAVILWTTFSDAYF